MSTMFDRDGASSNVMYHREYKSQSESGGEDECEE